VFEPLVELVLVQRRGPKTISCHISSVKTIRPSIRVIFHQGCIFHWLQNIVCHVLFSGVKALLRHAKYHVLVINEESICRNLKINRTSLIVYIVTFYNTTIRIHCYNQNVTIVHRVL